MALPLPVNGIIDDFNVGPLTVTRRGVPTLNAYGEMVDAAAVTFQVNPVAAHNLTGRDLLSVPEADRVNEVTQFYTKVRLYTATDNQAADVITYNSRDWRIIGVQDYQTQGACWIAQGVLVDQQF